MLPVEKAMGTDVHTSAEKAPEIGVAQLTVEPLQQPALDGSKVVPVADITGDQGPSAAQSWLNIQCNMISGVSRGLVFQVAGDLRSAQVEASWPGPSSNTESLKTKVLIAALRQRVALEPVSEAEAGVGDEPLARIYHPIISTEQPARRLVVVLEMSARPEAERKAVTNLLRWNGEWLTYALSNISRGGGQDLSAVFLMVAACLDQQEFRGTAMTLVSELAVRFGCQRVSLGLCRRKQVEVQVLSHSSRVKQQANLVQRIGAAMDEAVDQDKVIVYPSTKPGSPVITQAHAELGSHTPQGSICTVPITDKGELIGALTLERTDGVGFDEPTVQLIEQLLAVIAPVLLLKYRDEQGLPTKAGQRLREFLRRLLGPEHIRLKVGALATLVLLLFFSVAQGDWRVTAQALVEGRVQRTIAAPFDGYIESAERRAGDSVELGQELGALDNKDLTLQSLKWSTLRQQLTSELREAMAQHNRSEVSIIGAKIEQAEAEVALLQEQLSRTRLLAPFDGLVIEGDLSQSLGMPVARGDVLFKVAPLLDYRIVLRVDEKDIAPVRVGQQGRLILTSMPAQPLKFVVDKVTPVSTAQDGSNFFRVEASLSEGGPALRPGMEGVGKIEVGEANLFWIWSRDLVNWLRLQLWTFWR
jgi:hypothetical protein